MTNDERDAVQARIPRQMKGLVAILLAIIVGIAVYVVVLILRPTPFDPLTYETVLVAEINPAGETVIPRVEPTDEMPTVLATDRAVPFIMRRCSTVDHEVDVTTRTRFVSVDTGHRYEFGDGNTFPVGPGCNTIPFRLEIPVPVLTEVIDINDLRDGAVASTWFVEGNTRPDAPGGVTTTWLSEQFVIIDDRPVFLSED